MPELPEVENVRRSLADLVVGRKILELSATYPRMVLTGFNQAKTGIEGQTIRGISRRGKYLIFEFDELVLVSHLRMEGKYRLEPLDFMAGKHDHLFVRFSDSVLVYQDVRKFGTWEILSCDEMPRYFEAKEIGPEPTVSAFDEKIFSEKLQRSKKKIKPHLLDQTLVAGLGNIYVDEVLWQAKIHPEYLSMDLTNRSKHLLHDSIIEILQKAVELGGSSIRTYQNALGKAGKMQEELKVYGKTGQPCPRCGTIIIKTKVAGRGTHFCPSCQRL